MKKPDPITLSSPLPGDADFKKEVDDRLNEWKVKLRADNVHMDTIPSEQVEKQRERIVKSLQKEWLAAGKSPPITKSKPPPEMKGGMSDAKKVSPKDVGDFLLLSPDKKSKVAKSPSSTRSGCCRSTGRRCSAAAQTRTATRRMRGQTRAAGGQRRR